MKIVIICGLSDDKVKASLLPLKELEIVEKLFLVRRSSVEMEKVQSYSPPRLIRWSLILIEIYRFVALCLVCIKEKPDCIYAIYFVPHGVYAAIVGRFFHIPVIQEIIGTDRPLVNQSKIFQRLLSQAVRIGVRGKFSQEQLSYLSLPKEKFFISLARNAIDFCAFRPDHKQKKFDIVYIGHLDQNKQVDLILDAFHILYQNNPRLKFLIIGDGPEKLNLIGKSEELGLKESVSFMGKQNNEEIPIFLNQSKIFVMASAFEGLPIAMIEALSCGLPVVVPNIGDISEVAVHGYNAILIDEIDKDSYAEALFRIISDQNLFEQLTKGALSTRKRFIYEYSLQNAIESWGKILLTIDF